VIEMDFLWTLAVDLFTPFPFRFLPPGLYRFLVFFAIIIDYIAANLSPVSIFFSG